MKRNYVKFLFAMSIVYNIGAQALAQTSDTLKDRFLQELQSGDVKDGCEIIVTVVNASLNAACVIPDVTISKVACAAAQIMNATTPAGIDPNVKHPITEAEVIICQLTYAASAASVTYTFEFAKDQSEEIRQTWNWLNSLEGSIQFLHYMSR